MSRKEHHLRLMFMALVILLAIVLVFGLIAFTASAGIPRSQVGADRDRVQGDPDSRGPGSSTNDAGSIDNYQGDPDRDQSPGSKLWIIVVD